MSRENFSLYIHIPFCRNHRCHYCDFNTYVGVEKLIPAYVDSVVKEIGLLSQSAGPTQQVKTIYIGGGTPSVIPALQIARIITSLQNNFNIIADCEISIESNPGTINPGYFHEIRQTGINRLSIGMQTAASRELHILGRQHNQFDVIAAVQHAREAGFNNLSLDLIFGIPTQSLSSWQDTLEQALDVKPEHLSLYALTLEEGTPLYQWVKRGSIPAPDDDLAAEMYEWASNRLEAVGFQQYEISNWASFSAINHNKQLSCQHNLQYWHNLPYLGIGAGAHGYAHGYRMENIADIQKYIKSIQDFSGSSVFPFSPANCHSRPISRVNEIEETMMVGLRLTEEGVSRDQFRQRFSCDIESVYGDVIVRMIEFGLLSWYGNKQERLCLTHRGRLLGNQVFMEFLLEDNE